MKLSKNIDEENSTNVYRREAVSPFPPPPSFLMCVCGEFFRMCWEVLLLLLLLPSDGGGGGGSSSFAKKVEKKEKQQQQHTDSAASKTDIFNRPWGKSVCGVWS